MPSDPLPLSPDETVDPETPLTKAGRDLLDAEDYNSRAFPLITERGIIAIEQEARTLARTEVIAELRAEVETMPTARIISQWDLVSRKAVLAALSRLGERE